MREIECNKVLFREYLAVTKTACHVCDGSSKIVTAGLEQDCSRCEGQGFLLIIHYSNSNSKYVDYYINIGDYIEWMDDYIGRGSALCMK